MVATFTPLIKELMTGELVGINIHKRTSNL